MKTKISNPAQSVYLTDCLRERASHGDREQFERLLEKIARADRAPLPEDRLPEDVEPPPG